MARTQATIYKGLSLSTANTGAPIWETPADQLATNANRLWAQWCPSMIMTRTIDSSLQYYEVASATADHPLYALRFPVLGSRQSLTMHPRMLTENVLGGDGKSEIFGLKSIGSGDASVKWYDLSATTSYAWMTADKGVAQIGSTGLDIVSVHMRSDDNSPGYVRMRGLEVHPTPHAGALPAGMDSTGFVPADDEQWDGDSPLSAGNLRDLDTSHGALHTQWTWPVCGYVDSLSSPLESVASDAADYEAVLGPIAIPSRTGENVESISYSALVDRDAGTSTDCKIRVSTRYGPTIGSPVIDSNEHTAFGTVAASNWETASNWADDSLEVRPNGCYLFVEAKGVSATETTRLLSFLAWAQER